MSNTKSLGRPACGVERKSASSVEAFRWLQWTDCMERKFKLTKPTIDLTTARYGSDVADISSVGDFLGASEFNLARGDVGYLEGSVIRQSIYNVNVKSAMSLPFRNISQNLAEDGTELLLQPEEAADNSEPSVSQSPADDASMDLTRVVDGEWPACAQATSGNRAVGSDSTVELNSQPFDLRFRGLVRVSSECPIGKQKSVAPNESKVWEAKNMGAVLDSSPFGQLDFLTGIPEDWARGSLTQLTDRLRTCLQSPNKAGDVATVAAVDNDNMAGNDGEGDVNEPSKKELDTCLMHWARLLKQRCAYEPITGLQLSEFGIQSFKNAWQLPCEAKTFLAEHRLRVALLPGNVDSDQARVDDAENILADDTQLSAASEELAVHTSLEDMDMFDTTVEEDLNEPSKPVNGHYKRTQSDEKRVASRSLHWLMRLAVRVSRTDFNVQPSALAYQHLVNEITAVERLSGLLPTPKTFQGKFLFPRATKIKDHMDFIQRMNLDFAGMLR